MKKRARELPRPRLLILFILMAIIYISAYFASDMPNWACILLAIFNADLVYYLFVVLKIHRTLHNVFSKEKDDEIQARENALNVAAEISREGIALLQNTDSFLPLSKGTKINLVGLRTIDMNYNGGGSAASDETKCITLEDGLRQSDFVLNEDLINLQYNFLDNELVSIAAPKKRKTKATRKTPFCMF